MNLEVKVSPDFRRQAARAVWSIVLFIATYIFLLAASVGLTALCIYGGIMMIAAKPTFITLALGIGLGSLGVLVLFFMLKFVLASNKVDRSHLIEIKRADEPQLFAMIDEIVGMVGTHFPKKVFLSADVNAAVFYDSTFWSMFFPVKKNLQIGLGLVNTVSKSELKAVLSHEFGHFSQRSMKVGSFVHNVNQVLHNLLYENEGYDEMTHRWANASGYFALFVLLAIKIVQGIKWILMQVYKMVNKNYLALSREMEFNADEVAAHVTGYMPLKTSLLRMTLADRAFHGALSHYEGKGGTAKPENFYRDQMFLLQFMGHQNQLAFIDGLPLVEEQDLGRYNKSKLKITDQWSSHPSDGDRIRMLEKTGQTAQPIDSTPANSLLRNPELVQRKLTRHLFRDLDPQDQWPLMDTETFREDYEAEFRKNKFPDIYRGYYDDKNPLVFDLSADNAPVRTPEILFSDAMIDAVYTSISLKNDIEILKQVSDPDVEIESFDYDGVRFPKKEAAGLVEKLEHELTALTETIRENDRAIYRFFAPLDVQNARLKSLYHEYFEFDRAIDLKSEIHTELSNALQFLQEPTQNEKIKSNLQTVVELEKTFAQQIRSLMDDDYYRDQIGAEIQESFNIYLGGERQYFADDKYIDADLMILFSAMQHYLDVLSRSYYRVKRNLLDYQAGLVGELAVAAGG